jgi:hypothetical protein
MAARVEKRMARARPFLRTGRLTTVILTRSDANGAPHSGSPPLACTEEITSGRPEIRSSHGQLCETVRFCDSPPSPAAAAGTGVHNPCPQPTSYNQRCHRVLRRLSHGPSARLRPRLHHRPAATSPSRRLDRAGSYRVFVETASGAAADWQASRRLARWCDVSRATPISMRRSSSEGEIRRCLQLPEDTDHLEFVSDVLSASDKLRIQGGHAHQASGMPCAALRSSWASTSRSTSSSRLKRMQLLPIDAFGNRS